MSNLSENRFLKGRKLRTTGLNESRQTAADEAITNLLNSQSMLDTQATDNAEKNSTYNERISSKAALAMMGNQGLLSDDRISETKARALSAKRAATKSRAKSAKRAATKSRAMSARRAARKSRSYRRSRSAKRGRK